jgi:hypothetical protein
MPEFQEHEAERQTLKLQALAAPLAEAMRRKKPLAPLTALEVPVIEPFESAPRQPQTVESEGLRWQLEYTRRIENRGAVSEP